MCSSSKNRRAFVLLCIVSVILYSILLFLQYFLTNRANFSSETRAMRSKDILRKADFSKEQVSKMSLLGKWLFSPEGTPPAATAASDSKKLILIWKHGVFLERRHIRRFGNNKFSPWENCTVKNCALSYKSEDAPKAAAIVFHLLFTKNKSELPKRTRTDQRWIFLSDESPVHTFSSRSQRISDYNGLFNWSMSYRTDSDIPVPYGRTILKKTENSVREVEDFKNYMKSRKTKLVVVLGSNCFTVNNRWSYVGELKKHLGNKLDIFGKCMGGNTTACPGHFNIDCSLLRSYKFYLAFENSNCREYLTEKVFWHGYEALAVPVIMGAPKEDCERLLPPRSFLHVSDFDSPADLANYMLHLDRQFDEYLDYYQWKRYYEVLNEHGYFGSVSRHYCRICEALHYNSPEVKVYYDLEKYWDKNKDCVLIFRSIQRRNCRFERRVLRDRRLCYQTKASLQQWTKHNKRTIWFKVDLSHSEWVPILTKHGFKFHHAKEQYVMLYLWLSNKESCNIPPYAHTNLGVGAFVYNTDTEELLVIKEKVSLGKILWKLPGGYVEPGENVEDAIRREVFEETGIETDFKCILGFRHGHDYAFGCSDIYMLAYLTPKTLDIQKCNREISECQWMKLNEYVQHPEVHQNNRVFAEKFITFLQNQTGFIVDYGLHPLTKKPICVYSISKLKTDNPS